MWLLNEAVKRLLCGLSQEQKGGPESWPNTRRDSMKADVSGGEGGIDATDWSVLIRRTWTSTVMPLMPTFALKCLFKQAVNQFSSIHSTIFTIMNTSAPGFIPSKPRDQHCFVVSPTEISWSGPGPGWGKLLVQIPFLPGLLDFNQNSFVPAYRPVLPCSSQS